VYDQKFGVRCSTGVSRKIANGACFELDGNFAGSVGQAFARAQGTPTQRQLSISSLRATYVSVWSGGQHVLRIGRRSRVYPFSILPSHCVDGTSQVPRLDGALKSFSHRVLAAKQVGGSIAVRASNWKVVGYHVSEGTGTVVISATFSTPTVSATVICTWSMFLVPDRLK